MVQNAQEMAENAQNMIITKELTKPENTSEDVLTITPLAKLDLLSNT